MSEMDFNARSKETITKLEKEFKLSLLQSKSINSFYSIGIEIEVKFKYYFPDLHKKYFAGGGWRGFSYEKREIINKEVDEYEKPTKDLLEKTIECGIPRGNDKYWEFAFNPANDLSLLVAQVNLLKDINLIPAGRHSLHITVGGNNWLNTDIKRVYYTLFVLELLFSDKERIREGFSSDGLSSAAWAKKGHGGVLGKNQFDLLDETTGFELRSLFLDENTNLEEMFRMLVFLLEDPKGKTILDKIRDVAVEFGLPDKNWKRPDMEPEIWNLYIEKFDNLSLKLKEIIE